MEKVNKVKFRRNKILRRKKYLFVSIPVEYSPDIEKWGLDCGFEVIIKPLPRLEGVKP